MARGTRYHVVSKIANGGMAEIFLALQQGEQGFQKPVVLKRILPALAADPKFVRMFVDEAHIASTLNHSNLVQVLDLGRSGGQYFLVLEFVDGWSLEQIRRRAQHAKLKLPVPLALTVVSALCRGLAYVHTRERNGKPLGIVHRDVTPQNVLISQHGEVKLADFGIAKAIGKSERSATGIIKGKFAYMSPEQSQALPLDARSDLFSVGTVLYLLTTGKKPFDGATDADVIMQVRRARPEKPSTVVRDLNPDVERLINRALRANPGKRWQSAEQMADQIDAILVKLGEPSGPAPLKRWLEDAERARRRQAARPGRAGRARSEHRRRSRQHGPGARGARGGGVDRRRTGSGHGPRHASPPRPAAPSPARRTRPRGRTRRGPLGWRKAMPEAPAASSRARRAAASSDGCGA